MQTQKNPAFKAAGKQKRDFECCWNMNHQWLEKYITHFWVLWQVFKIMTRYYHILLQKINILGSMVIKKRLIYKNLEVFIALTWSNTLIGNNLLYEGKNE